MLRETNCADGEESAGIAASYSYTCARSLPESAISFGRRVFSASLCATSIMP